MMLPNYGLLFTSDDDDVILKISMNWFACGFSEELCLSLPSFLPQQKISLFAGHNSGAN